MKTIPITKTIMFTDIVGYSTLVSNNETLAMSLLDEHNNILMSLFEKYDGKIIKHTGDGFFVTFEDSNELTYLDNGDINCDNLIDISDIVGIIFLILGEF